MVPSMGLSGGMWLLWESFVKVEVLGANSWFSHCNVDLSMNGKEESFVLSCVYGNPKLAIRKMQWAVLPLLKPQNDEKWIVMGDFNEVTTQTEKRGGRPFNFVQAIPFLDMIAACELIDLGFIGNIFTWTNKQVGRRRIWERLDRTLVNASWILHFVNTKVYHHMSMTSDHKLLVIKICNESNHLPRPFRFEAMWLQDRSCTEQVQLAFEVDTVGSPSFTLCNKLKQCQKNLKWWNKNIFGLLDTKMQDAHHRLEQIQYEILSQTDPGDDLFAAEHTQIQRYNDLLVQQATH
ncbi:hypothetical protein IFM89_011334 [Coptis chinensis]|uniref:Endonuclease/exonuclease/phosphatase domain-containing protein n=1 Tax=Coptis chinensis TaxID=261450 RepID=A0A835IVF2_9MAGN|nr:hypothetical protein IFM89_011334 [Coptis chinensis]